MIRPRESSPDVEFVCKSLVRRVWHWQNLKAACFVRATGYVITTSLTSSIFSRIDTSRSRKNINLDASKGESLVLMYLPLTWYRPMSFFATTIQTHDKNRPQSLPYLLSATASESLVLCRLYDMKIRKLSARVRQSSLLIITYRLTNLSKLA